MKKFLQFGLAVSAAFAMSAMAQQPAWKQGMPESMSNSTLAPLAAKLTATKAADIDLSRLKLPAGSAMGWQSKGAPMNHFDQRFPLRADAGPVLLLTQAGEEEVRRAFPHAVPANPLKSNLVASETIAYGAWWLE